VQLAVAFKISRQFKSQLKKTKDRLLAKIELVLTDNDLSYDKSVRETEVFMLFRETLKFVYQHPLQHFYQSLQGADV